MSLKQEALRGVKWTAIENVLGAVFSVASLAILARLLEPRDFGLMALANVVLGFSRLFADMGINNAIIYRQELSRRQLSTLYWMNLLAGFSIAVAVAASAIFISRFYQQPRLVPILLLIDLGLFVQVFAQQFVAILQKELKFELLSRIGIVSRFSGAVLAIVLAYEHFGVYALVLSSLATAVIASVLTVVKGLKMFCPRLEFRFAEVRSLVGFGMYQVGERALNYFASHVDAVLIGRLLGADALGVYAVAKELIMRPAQVVNPIVTRVSTPVMAKVQRDIPRMRSMYLAMINRLSSLNFPFYTAMCIFAHELTSVVLGEQWLAVVPVIQILAIFGAVRSISNPVGSLLLATGRVRRGFWWNAALLALLPMVLYAGSRWGLVGISWSLLATQIVLALATWMFLVQPLCGAGFAEYHVQIVGPVLVAVVGGLVAWSAAYFIEGDTGRLAVGLAAGGAASFAAVCAFNRDLVKDLSALFGTRGATSPNPRTDA